MTEKSSFKLVHYLIPRISDVLFIVVLLYISVFAGSQMLADGDTGYHIRAGDLMLKTGAILHSDPFSYHSPQLPWTAHEWLSEVVMSLCHHMAGLPGVVFLFALVIAITNRYFFGMLVRNGHGILFSTIFVIAFIAAAQVHWLARPHIFSLLFLLFWFDSLEKLQEGKAVNLWLLPASMLLWVNLHGGYIAGIFLLFLYLAGNLVLFLTDRTEWTLSARNRTIRIAKLTGWTLAAALLNPSGYKIFIFPFTLAMNKELVDSTIEFLSPNFHEFSMLKYLILMQLAILAWSRRRMQPIHLFILIFFLNMALFSVRYGPLFALFLIPIMMKYIDFDLAAYFPRVARFFSNREQTVSSVEKLARGIVWPVVTVVFVCLLIVTGRISYGFDPAVKAVNAMEFLKKEYVSGKVFNNDEFGDLMIYTLSDRYKVFIDGRLDMYQPTGKLKEYLAITSFKPDWNDILKKYTITWILFDTQAPFTRFLYTQPDWRLIYSDKVASIFVKNVPEYRRLIKKYPHVQLARVDDEKR
jgi:hypothetical protein